MATGLIPTISFVNRTTDGGKTWEVVFMDTGYTHRRQDPIFLRGAVHPTPNLCIVVGDSGAILRTADGGTSWQRIPCDATYDGGAIMNLFSISMCDSLHGIAAGFTRVLLRTNDGGLSWDRLHTSPTDTDSEFGIADAACLSPSTYVLGMARWGGYHTLRTSDSGRTWERIESDTALRFSFVDSLHGWGVGSGWAGQGHFTDEIITRTADGGRTWQNLIHQNAQAAYGYWSVAFADREYGFATADNGKIMHTTDGGDHWFRSDSIPTGSNIHAPCIAYPVRGKAWAGTIQGQILHYDEWAVSGVDDAAHPAATAGLHVTTTVGGDEITVRYTLPARGTATLDLVDVRGERVRLLADGIAEAGEHAAHVNAAELPAGLYFARLHAGPSVAVQKLPIVH